MPIEMINQSGGGNGELGLTLLNSGFDVSSLRTLDVLQKEEWVAIDKKVTQVARDPLIGVADLLTRGLTYNLNNALGVTRLEWESMGEMTPASMSMSGLTEDGNDRITYSLEGMPIPLIHKGFNMNIRQIASTRNSGQPLDLVQAELAGRLVAEEIEALLFNGSDAVAGGEGLGIKGYTNVGGDIAKPIALKTGDGQPSSGSGWDDNSWTGEHILEHLLLAIESLLKDNKNGPFIVYVPISWEIKLNKEFKTNSDKSIKSRLMEISQIADIRTSVHLSYATVKSAIMLQLTSDVVDMIDGIQPTTVRWDSQGGLISHFKVLAIMIPRIRTADKRNQSGIRKLMVAA